MEAFKKRLLDEFFELKERREKLFAFIEVNPKFGELDERQRHYMEKQLEHMTGYQECLDARIKDLIGWDEIEAYKEGLVPQTTGENIIADKECRVAIDEVLQKVKNLPPSRERSLTITKLQEGIMWLGMDLKRLGGTNPYPDSMNPSNTNVEKTADGLKL